MRIRHIHIVLFAFILQLIVVQSVAQIDSFTVIDNAVDELYDNIVIEDIEYASEDILESMHDRTLFKLPNLNDLSYETAVSVLNLSDYQYYQLQLYIEEYGQLYSVYELLAIDGYTIDDFERLVGISVVEPPPKSKRTFREVMRDGKNVFWIRYGQILERQAGYDTARDIHYNGSPANVVFRYEYKNSNCFGVKIAGGKSPGEEFFRGDSKYGFARYSGSAYIGNIGILKKFVMGDFRANFGQGLLLGSSLLSGRGGGVGELRKFGDGLRPVATTGVSNVFRGCGLTLGNAVLSGTAFCGVLTNADIGALGAAMKYSGKRFRIGAQIAGFGEPESDSTKIGKWRSLFHPSSINASIDYSTTVGRQLFFGEVAADEKGRFAILHSFVFAITPDFKLGAVFRHYSKDYSPVMGSPFKANTLGCGETGFYIAGALVLNSRMETEFFADYYRLHSPSYRADAPLDGLDMGVSILCKFTRNSDLRVRYKWRNKPKNESEDPRLHRLVENSSHRIRLQWNSSPYKFLKLRTELSIVINRVGRSAIRKGVLMYQDAAFVLGNPDLNFHIRAAYFDTDSYDERLYAYENDVYYAFNVGSYCYQGARWYIMVRYKFGRFGFWLRAGRTHYLNRETVGSSLNLIDKPYKTDVKAQFMVTF